MLNSTPPEDIRVSDYPELSLILWDWGASYISAEDALQAYESRWPYVDKGALTEKETALIDLLIEKYGNGVFLSA